MDRVIQLLINAAALYVAQLLVDGLDFDFSAIASGVYGAIIVIVMLLRPNGLVPAHGAVGAERRRGRPWF